MRVVLRDFRIVDEETDALGTVYVEDGRIVKIKPGPANTGENEWNAALIIDGAGFSTTAAGPAVLMPAFVDLHTHFRDPGFPGPPPEKETLESACLSALAGGFTTAVCMANTIPVIDSPEKVLALKKRSDALGLVDLYPAMSLTRGMEGKELSPIGPGPLMLSEDGKDLADDALFLAAMKEAKRIVVPISCHCDYGGPEAQAAKEAGQPRITWSRIEESNAVRRVIELGEKAGCRIHIAHLSTKEAAGWIRAAKCHSKVQAQAGSTSGGFRLSCEVTPHNLCLTDEDARRLGDESWGRVNPPLQSEEDRKVLIEALCDGTIDIIATDHAPHSNADKEKGVPGYSGFETAFAAVYTELVRSSGPRDSSPIDLKRLSFLMSANPARLLGFGEDRGRVQAGYRADLIIVDTQACWTVDPALFKTRGKNSPFAGRKLYGKILMTLRGGRVVFGG